MTSTLRNVYKQEKYWDEVAEEKDFPTPFQIEKFKKYVSLEMRILDVGCGYGRTLNELHNNGFKNLTGLDFSLKMINRGLRLYPYLNLRKNNGDELPFADNIFDSIIIMGVLTSNVNNKKQQSLILEITRVLKDGGILYITDFLLNSDGRNLERYQKYEDKYATYGVFELPEGAVLRHHTTEHILNLTSEYDELLFEKTVYKTMNGNKSNGFYYIGKKQGNI